MILKESREWPDSADDREKRGKDTLSRTFISTCGVGLYTNARACHSGGRRFASVKILLRSSMAVD